MLGGEPQLFQLLGTVAAVIVRLKPTLSFASESDVVVLPSPITIGINVVPEVYAGVGCVISVPAEAVEAETMASSPAMDVARMRRRRISPRGEGEEEATEAGGIFINDEAIQDVAYPDLHRALRGGSRRLLAGHRPVRQALSSQIQILRAGSTNSFHTGRRSEFRLQAATSCSPGEKRCLALDALLKRVAEAAGDVGGLVVGAAEFAVVIEVGRAAFAALDGKARAEQGAAASPTLSA